MKRNSSIGAKAVNDILMFHNAGELLGIDRETQELLKQEAAKLFIPCRQKLQEAINHQSYEDLAALLAIVRENVHNFTIITRHDLEEALCCCSLNHVLKASRLLEKEGPKEAMLLLLRQINDYNFKSRLHKISMETHLKK